MPEERPITLLANKEEMRVVSGSYFAVISCTGPFEVEADKRGSNPMGAGRSFGPQPFRRLRFIDTSGRNNQIRFFAGDSPYAGPFTTPSEQSETFDAPDLTAATGAFATISSVTPTLLGASRNFGIANIYGIRPAFYRRRKFTITNRSTNDVGLYHTGGPIVGVVFDHSADTFTLDFDVNLQGIGGNALIACVCTYDSTPFAEDPNS
jgi:hypothetical protein